MLGRPWQFDRRVTHDCYTNKYTIPYRGKTIALVPLTPSQVLEDQKFLQSEQVRRVREKREAASVESEPKESGQRSESETHSEERQERKDKHTIPGVERKESQKKSFLLRKCESFPITMFSLLQEVVNTKPPELPSFQGIKQPFIPKWNYKKHHKFVFEQGDWIRIPGEHHYSDLRTNPFEEEENDATLVSMQPTITDPGDLMTKGRNERAQIQEQACRLARKDDEATKTSN